MSLLSVVIGRGTHASRPAAGTAGSLYYETDTKALFRDNGSSWDAISFSDVLTTQGDLIYGGASAVPTRLAVGSSGKVLTSDGTSPTWGNGPMTTKGDIMAGGASGAITRLAVGTDGQVLTADSAQTLGVKWGAAGSGGYTQGARAYNSANISIPNNTVTTLTYNSERYDTDTIHDTSSNTSRLTCKTAGKYIIGSGIQWAQNTAGRRLLQITLNGTTTIAAVEQNPDGSGSLFSQQSVTTAYDLAVNDYVETTVFQNSGGSLNVVAAGNSSPEFWMSRVG